MKNIIYTDKQHYLDTIQAWKDTCKDKSFPFQPEHFALYAILRGKDPKKCFASPEQQSRTKLVGQGKHGNEAYNRAMMKITNTSGYYDAELLAPFQGQITKMDLELLRTSLSMKEAA